MRQLEHSLIVADGKVWVACPKTGCFFTHDCLYAAFPDAKPLAFGHAPAWLIRNEYRHLPTVGAVRNPWDWYLSSWSFAQSLKQEKEEFEPYVRSLMKDPWRILSERFRSAAPSTLQDKIGLLTYFHVAYFSRSRAFMAKRLTTEFIAKNYEQLTSPSIMMKTETLERDLAEVYGPGVKKAFGDAFKNTSQHPHRHDMYSLELKQLVERKDQFIIERFGYKF